MQQYFPKIQENEMLLSRQIIEGIFTTEDQKKLQAYSCLIVGLKGLGFEIVKNLNFLGVQNIFLCDDRRTEEQDKTFNMFAETSQLYFEQNKSNACKSSMEKYQKNCQITVVTMKDIQEEDFLVKNNINCVLVTEFIFDNLKELFQLNSICRQLDIGFVFSISSIVFSFQYSCFSKEQKTLEEIYQNQFEETADVFKVFLNIPRNFKLHKKRTYALFKFIDLYSLLPQYMNDDHFQKFQNILNELGFQFNREEINENSKLAVYSSLSFIVQQSFWAPFTLGSLIEHIKFKGREGEDYKKQIICWSDFNLVKQDFLNDEGINIDDRFLNEKRIFGKELFGQIQQGNYLVAGCGAVGCEQAKLLTLLSFQNILFVDNDTIEISNLNRQIFYGREDNKLFKSNVLAQKIRQINTSINTSSLVGYLCTENEEKLLSEEEYNQFDLIMCCFDNPQGRYYLSQIARQQFICLIDSATHGFMSQSQIQVPHFISRIQIANQIQSLQNEIPKCTLTKYHKTPLEAIAWCKYLFENEFLSNRSENLDDDLYLKNEDLLSLLKEESSLLDIISLCKNMIKNVSMKIDQNTQEVKSFKYNYSNELTFNLIQIVLQIIGDQNIQLSFDQLFISKEELQLIKLSPNQTLQQIEFDKSNLIHLNFLYYLTDLRCQLFGLQTPEPLYVIQKGNDINGALITSTSQSAASAFLEYFKYALHKQELKSSRNDNEISERVLKQIQFRRYDIWMTVNLMYSQLKQNKFFLKKVKQQSISLNSLIQQIENEIQSETLDQIAYSHKNETFIIHDRDIENNILYDKDDIQELLSLQQQDLNSICKKLNIPFKKNKFYELKMWITKQNQESQIGGLIRIYE